MVRHASLFSQLVALFGRKKFNELVYRHQSERFAKKFNSWDHFVSMLFCQIAQAKSLREICGGLACCMGKMRHLGMIKAPNKSTLSYANAHRPWQMYQDLFYHTLGWCKSAAAASVGIFLPFPFVKTGVFSLKTTRNRFADAAAVSSRG